MLFLDFSERVERNKTLTVRKRGKKREKKMESKAMLNKQACVDECRVFKLVKKQRIFADKKKCRIVCFLIAN